MDPLKLERLLDWCWAQTQVFLRLNVMRNEELINSYDWFLEPVDVNCN